MFRARKMLHLNVICWLLDLLMSKLEISFKTLRKNIKSLKCIHCGILILRAYRYGFSFTIFTAYLMIIQYKYS